MIDEPSTANTSEPAAEEVKEAPTFAEEVPSDAETPVPEDESEEEVVDEPIEFVIEFGADESDVVVAPDRCRGGGASRVKTPIRPFISSPMM